MFIFRVRDKDPKNKPASAKQEEQAKQHQHQAQFNKATAKIALFHDVHTSPPYFVLFVRRPARPVAATRVAGVFLLFPLVPLRMLVPLPLVATISGSTVRFVVCGRATRGFFSLNMLAGKLYNPVACTRYRSFSDCGRGQPLPDTVRAVANG